MEEPRVKILQKQQKKADTMINDLMLLSDAQRYIMMNTGADVGVCTQIAAAIRSLQKASYELLIAIASAEGQEMVGQMMADLDDLTARAKGRIGHGKQGEDLPAHHEAAGDDAEGTDG